MALIDRATGGLSARRVRQAWIWLLPLVVAGLVRWSSVTRLERGIGLLLALALTVAVLRRPEWALLLLLVAIPFQLLGLSLLLRLGLPPGFTRMAGFWKEVVLAAIVVAAVRQSLASGKGLDLVDRLCLLYLVLVSLYLVVPGLFAPSAPTDPGTLRVAFRSSVGFIVLFVAARHLEVPPDFRRRLGNALFAVGVVIGALGVLEFLFSAAWNHLAVNGFQIPRYKALVLDAASRDYSDVRVYGLVGGRRIIRLGSVFYDQLACGLYLVIPFAIGVERLARKAARPLILFGTTLIGLTILFTQTRAAIVAALVVALFALRPAPGRSPASRVRFGVLLAVAVAALVPLAAGTGLVDRTTGAFTGADESADTHLGSLGRGLEVLVEHPLGQGLATGGSTAGRFGVVNQVTSENYYLQVGNETGIQSMLLFLTIVVVVGVRLRRTLSLQDNDVQPDLLVAAWWASFVGLSLAGLLLHVWLDFIVSWTWWGVAGVLLGASDLCMRSPEVGAGVESFSGRMAGSPAP